MYYVTMTDSFMSGWGMWKPNEIWRVFNRIGFNWKTNSWEWSDLLISTLLYMIDSFFELFGKPVLYMIALYIIFQCGSKQGEINGTKRAKEIMNKALNLKEKRGWLWAIYYYLV